MKTRAFMAAAMAYAMFSNGSFSPEGDRYSGVGMGTASYDNFNHVPSIFPTAPRTKKQLKARAMSRIQKKQE